MLYSIHMSPLQWISGSVFIICIFAFILQFIGINLAFPDSGLDEELHPADRHKPISNKKAVYITILIIVAGLRFLTFIASF